MLDAFTAMFAVTLTWAVMASVFIGLGLMARRLLRVPGPHSDSAFSHFFVGWGVSIAFLELWHFFLRVDWRASVIIAAVGGFGLVSSTSDWCTWLHRCRKMDKKIALYSVPAALLAIMWLSNQAIGPPKNYDTGLYHLNVIRWTTTYPIVPGLGNLHGNFAFNNSSLLYLAMLEIPPWQTMSRHFGNGLIILVLLLQIILSLPRLRQLSRPSSIRDFFLVLVLLPTLFIGASNASSASTDVAVFVLGIVLTSQLLNLAFRPVEASDHDEFLVFSICFLSAIGVTAKLSFLASAFTISAAALAIYVARRRRVPKETGRRSILPIVAMSAAVVLVPHLTRNVLLSGSIMYPSPLGPFPVDWRIPEPVVRNAQNGLWAWARRPGVPWVDVLGNWNWLGSWAKGAIVDRWNVQAPAMLAVLGGLVLLYHAVTIGWTTITWRRWLLVLPVLLSIAFW